MATTKKPKSNTSKALDLDLDADEPSLLFTIRELIRNSGIDFDEWWKEFKVGFINGKRDKDTNWKTVDWIKPKYVDITPSTSISGAKTIEFWLDKDKKEESQLLSGTTADLISGIMAIMREQKALVAQLNGKGSKPLLKGLPCIKLVFKDEKNNIYGVKQIRCVGYTELEKVAAVSKNIELLKEADVNRWSKNIKAIFGDTEYVWQKGTSCLSYSGMIARLQGIEGYAYVKSEADGIKLFTAMLKIFEQRPDADCFNFSEKSNENQFKIDKTVTVLGRKVKLDKHRPIADCKFIGAYLVLESVKKPIMIVRGNVALSVNLTK